MTDVEELYQEVLQLRKRHEDLRTELRNYHRCFQHNTVNMFQMTKLKEGCESDIRMFSARMYNIRDETLKTVYQVSDKLNAVPAVDPELVRAVHEQIQQISK